MEVRKDAVSLYAVRPILFSSPPMIGLCGGEFKKTYYTRTIKMTNSNLITVFNGQIANQQVQLANARELYTFLEVKNNFANWINDRISDYGFIQDEDYIIVHERTNGRPRKEYHITLDMGKELAMVERNEKGRQIRKYFIECERRANLQNQPQQLALPEPEKKYTFEFTEDDLLDLTWAWFAFIRGIHTFRAIYTPLNALGSNYSAMVYGQGYEYATTARNALKVIQRLTKDIAYDYTSNWRVLKHVREFDPTFKKSIL